MPLRLVHFADVHLGVETYGRFDPATGLNTRLIDFTNRLDEVVEYALAWPADLVLFAGDAYRSRDPSPTQQREFAKRVRLLSQAGIPTFLLVGNHDLPAATGRANSLDIYDTLAVPNITVARQLGVHRVETPRGPLQVVAVPWLRRSSILSSAEHRSLTPEQTRQLIEQLASSFISENVAKLDPSIPAVLAAHVSVDGATYSSERSVLIGEDIVLPRSAVADPAFAYVALGHIHKHQVLSSDPPVIYPGSLERVDFGEESDPKGFIAAEIGDGPTRYEFRPVAARRFVTVRSKPSGVFPTDTVLKDLERAATEGAIVRLIVEAEAEVDANVDYAAIRRALRDAYCVAGIRREVQRADRRQGGAPGMESLSPIDALDIYFRQRDMPDARRKLLREYAQKLEASPA